MAEFSQGRVYLIPISRLKGKGHLTMAKNLYMGYDCNPFVLVVETGSKTLNVHVKYRDTLELGYSTKPTNKHKFNDFISMKSKQVDTYG